MKSALHDIKSSFDEFRGHLRIFAHAANVGQLNQRVDVVRVHIDKSLKHQINSKLFKTNLENNTILNFKLTTIFAGFIEDTASQKVNWICLYSLLCSNLK